MVVTVVSEPSGSNIDLGGYTEEQLREKQEQDQNLPIIRRGLQWKAFIWNCRTTLQDRQGNEHILMMVDQSRSGWSVSTCLHNRQKRLHRQQSMSFSHDLGAFRSGAKLRKCFVLGNYAICYTFTRPAQLPIDLHPMAR